MNNRIFDFLTVKITQHAKEEAESRIDQDKNCKNEDEACIFDEDCCGSLCCHYFMEGNVFRSTCHDARHCVEEDI